jgi:hypothetical protein
MEMPFEESEALFHEEEEQERDWRDELLVSFPRRRGVSARKIGRDSHG